MSAINLDCIRLSNKLGTVQVILFTGRQKVSFVEIKFIVTFNESSLKVNPPSNCSRKKFDKIF